MMLKQLQSFQCMPTLLTFLNFPQVFALLLLAGLALAEPEATPEADAAADAWYGYYGHGLGYRRYYGGYYGGWRGYGGWGYGYYGRKKREADPAVLATTHSAPAVAPLVHPYGYALGYGYGLHHAPTVGYTVEHKATEHIPGAVTAVAGEPTVVHVGYAGKKFNTSFYVKQDFVIDQLQLAESFFLPSIFKIF